MTDDQSPADPMTQMAEGAAEVHEMFLSYVAAGFTNAQAITLVSAILTALIHNANGGTA
jgi:hypothetical protein